MKYASNRYRDIKRQLLAELKGLYDEREIRQMIFLLYEAYAGVTRTELAIDPNRAVSESQLLKIHFAARDLKKHRPIQYITGKAYFYGLEFHVDESVLVPRPETEGLVAWLLDDLGGTGPARIIDLGTGSGCIAVTLKKHLAAAAIEAVDFKEEALALAGENAHRHGCDISMRIMDLEVPSTWPEGGHYDVIVSNPPYVLESEKVLMKPNVLEFEPQHALFVPDEQALRYYEMILSFARAHLSPGGSVYVEINENLGRETCRLFEKEGFKEVRLKKDLQGRDRYIRAR